MNNFGDLNSNSAQTYGLKKIFEAKFNTFFQKSIKKFDANFLLDHSYKEKHNKLSEEV